MRPEIASTFTGTSSEEVIARNVSGSLSPGTNTPSAPASTYAVARATVASTVSSWWNQ